MAVKQVNQRRNVVNLMGLVGGVNLHHVLQVEGTLADPLVPAVGTLDDKRQHNSPALGTGFGRGVVCRRRPPCPSAGAADSP